MPKVTRALVGVIVILLGVIVYQKLRLRDLSFRTANLRERLASAATRAASVRPTAETSPTAEPDTMLRASIAPTRTTENAHAVEQGGISERVEALKDSLKRLPDQWIPQIAYATDGDWFSAVDGRLETAEDFRIALARLRASGERRFADKLSPALRAYLDTNAGVFPKDVAQLKPFFTQPVDLAALQHYKIVRADSERSVRVGGDWAITQASLIDSKYDAHVVIGPHGFGAYGGPPH